MEEIHLKEGLEQRDKPMVEKKGVPLAQFHIKNFFFYDPPSIPPSQKCQIIISKTLYIRKG